MKQALISKHPLTQKKKLPEDGKKKRVIVIAGPTASGKTQLSLSLAQAIGGEIVSADSMQVYRGMDIGTAKASPEERGLIAHHMIDICDLDENFNVAEFYYRCQDTFHEIAARDNVPIVVGGSGFYIHALLYGPPAGPPSSPDVRDLLERQMRELGPEVLFERLQMLDPHYAKTISERDRHKIVRALEIIALSDRKVSEFPKADRLQEQDFDFRCWFIYYPRDKLYSRIELRCEEMVRKGFVEEVRALEQRGLRLNSSAAQAIGYAQALRYLDTPQSDADYQEFMTQFKKASRHYSKRQFTWFRKEPIFRWLNIAEYPTDRIKELILQDFEQGM
ncbi:MAG: tRNA (adenosine(37)-N6)-dimethylallyltransferase MiaA [Verrucomicrobia bacterium]|nr:tRNA (adenosine(37)-N6)-dimethylallyltransferase MiaA [Verrucomicrobiota bacterium]